MNSCEKFEIMISELIDGELSAQDSAQLRAHLLECSACRELAEAMAMVSAELRSEPVPVPEGFAEGVMSRIEAEGGIRVIGGKKKVKPMYKRYAAVAAVFAVIVIAAGSGLGGMFSKMNSADKAESATYMNDAELSDSMTGTQYSVTDGESAVMEPAEAPAAPAAPAAPEAPAEPAAPAPMEPAEAPEPESSEMVSDSVYLAAKATNELPPAIPYSRDFYAILVVRGGVPAELEDYEAEAGAESELYYIVPANVVDELYARLEPEDMCSLYIGISGTAPECEEGLVMVYG